MLKFLLEKDRRLRIDHKKLLNCGFSNHHLLKVIDDYLNDFARYNNLSIDEILKRYNNFLLGYSKDIENFLSTGEYPYLLEENIFVERTDYDISLILSTVVTIHRFRIMDNFFKYNSVINGKVLIIGLGSGIELEILSCSSNKKEIDAYDISVSKFVKNRFKKTLNIVEGEFKGNDSFYDYIIAIELLEHLENPYHFLSMCFNSLKNEGTLVTTTATDVPQFDHLYNFNDDNVFSQKINKLGFIELQKEDIEHNYMNKSINAKNTWYVLKKDINR